MELKEFKINSCTQTFRIMRMSMIEVLALQSIMDTDNMDKLVQCYSFILEHIEVNIADRWVPVKEKGKDIYYPVNIQEDAIAQFELIRYVLTEFIKPLFQKSNE